MSRHALDLGTAVLAPYNTIDITDIDPLQISTLQELERIKGCTREHIRFERRAAWYREHTPSPSQEKKATVTATRPSSSMLTQKSFSFDTKTPTRTPSPPKTRTPRLGIFRSRSVPEAQASKNNGISSWFHGLIRGSVRRRF